MMTHEDGLDDRVLCLRPMKVQSARHTKMGPSLDDNMNGFRTQSPPTASQDLLMGSSGARSPRLPAEMALP